MGKIPTVEEAAALLDAFNEEPFHRKHGRIVSDVMGYFAKEYDPERVDYWRAVGMLHDLDFEKYPEQHCVKEQEMMREADIDEGVIRAAASHGYPAVPIEPQQTMEKVLYAVDELTGLIGAVALMRPSKSVQDLELKSVKKKFKTLNFAAGCSREVIQNGADMLGWSLDELIERTILAMRASEQQA